MDSAETYNIPEGYVMIQDNILDMGKCSQNILIKNEGRTATINPYYQTDGNVKTVLGTNGMERPQSQEDGPSKFYMLFRLESIGSKCVCVGIQQQGADLEKDSFDFRYGFQLNCINGDICRLGQTKEYVNLYKQPITSNSVIGVMLNMWDGELQFQVDGVNCGSASKDKRLKQGKYFSAVLLMSKDDKVTLLNPRKLTKANLAYETLLTRIGVHQPENERFYALLEQLQEYFTDQTTEKNMHKLVLGAFLNNQSKFEEICSKARGFVPNSQKPSLTEVKTQSKISVQGAQSQKAPEFKGSVSNGYVLQRLIENFMSPTLVHYQDFHEEFILLAFEKYVHYLIGEIMNLHFMLQDISGQSLPQVGDMQRLTMTPEEAKNLEDKPAAALNEKPAEIVKVEKDFIALQIHAKFTQYPMPKVSQELQSEAQESTVQLFKLKLLDFTEKITDMSAVEFDQICKGRIPKQTQESCFQVSKHLFSAIKTAEELLQKKEKDERANDDKVKFFKDFASRLD